jgi:hypothetical protein
MMNEEALLNGAKWFQLLAAFAMSHCTNCEQKIGRSGSSRHQSHFSATAEQEWQSTTISEVFDCLAVERISIRVVHQLLNQFIPELLLWMVLLVENYNQHCAEQWCVGQSVRCVKDPLTVCWSCRVFDGVPQPKFIVVNLGQAKTKVSPTLNKVLGTTWRLGRAN